MLLLIKWICAHLLGDFVFQTSRMVQHKKIKKAKSGWIYFHCLLHALLIYVFTGWWQNFYIPLIIFVSHFLIDLWKLNQKESALTFIIDQVAHFVILILLWIVFVAGWRQPLHNISLLLNNPEPWILFAAYLIVIWPFSYMLGLATKKWRLQAEEQLLLQQRSLNDAGRWIGIFERILVLTFMLTNHFEGIGFLIAAKSILRFNDLKVDKQRKETEYILIGTLMSFTSSIILGLITSALLFY